MPPAPLGLAAALAALLVPSGALGGQRPASASPAPPATVRIEGVVKDAGGKPVDKALVMARALGEGESAPTLHGRSDAAGRFVFAVPRAGRYALRVEAPGLAPHTTDRLAVPAAPLTITLQKGASIAGVVRDGRGRPVPGARVEATRREWTGGWARPALPLHADAGRVRATTDARGVFRLDGLTLAAHQVTASARGLGGTRRDGVVPGTRVELYLAAGASVRGVVHGPDGRPLPGATVNLTAEMPMLNLVERTDERGAFEFWGVASGRCRIVAHHAGAAPAAAALALERNAEKTVALSLGPPARVRGRLVDAEERPVTAARLVLQEVEGEPVAATLGALFRAEPGADGRFVLEGLPRRPLALGITARGHAPARVEAQPRGPDHDMGDVVLEHGLTIRGRVRDEAGQGIGEARVTAGPAPVQRLARGVLETATEADGRFVIAGAEQGLYSVMAVAPGFAARSARASAGADGVGLVLPRAGSITGMVVDEKGAAVPAFEATATPVARDGDWMPAFGDGADGRFHLEDVAPGEWTVQVKAPQKVPATVSPVRVRPGAPTDAGRIRLLAGGSVKGRVTDAAGSAVAGANVWAEPVRPNVTLSRGGPRGVFTDASGAFELQGVEPGRVNLVASHPEYVQGRTSGVEVDPATGPAEARITLTAGGRLEGLVRRRDGRPLERMRVQVTGQVGGRFYDQVDVRADGRFSLEHVQTATVHVTLLVAMDETLYTGVQQRQVEVSEGATTPVEFLLRDILVAGTVTRRGEPAAGVRLTMSGPTGGGMYGGVRRQISAPPVGPQRGWAVTGADGRYELIVSEPGPYTASLTSADGRLNYPGRPVQVPDADAYALDLAIGGISVSGQTVDAESGAPLEAGIGVLPAAGGIGRPAAQTLSTIDGRFQLELEPGDYTLLARAVGHAPETVSLEVAENGAPELRIALSRGETISGRIVDGAGRPVGALPVMAFPEEAGTFLPIPPRQIAQSSPDGVFTIRGLGRGRHTLTAADEEAGFVVRPGVSAGTGDVLLRLGPGGRVRALVLRPDGTPAAGMLVGVTKVDGRPFMSFSRGSTTDTSGVCEWSVPAGHLEVSAMGQPAERGSASVTVAVGETASVEVRLQAREPGK